MIVLGLDQSLTCSGVVIMDEGERVYAGVITTKKTERVGMEDVFYRTRMIAAELQALINHYKVQTVVMEGLSFGSRGNATRDLALLMGTIQANLRGFPRVVPPPTLKKFATGNGKATKDEMVQAIAPIDPELFEQLMQTPKTKGRADIADAYWLATHGVRND